MCLREAIRICPRLCSIAKNEGMKASRQEGTWWFICVFKLMSYSCQYGIYSPGMLNSLWLTKGRQHCGNAIVIISTVHLVWYFVFNSNQKLFEAYWNLNTKYRNKMHMEMFLSYSKNEWMFISWISKDWPLHKLLSDLKDIAISKIINPFVLQSFNFSILCQWVPRNIKDMGKSFHLLAFFIISCHFYML